MQEDGNDIIELINDDGSTERFEHIMTLEYNEKPYLIMHPVDGADLDEGAVVVFAVETDGDTESYIPVEDEDVANQVFAEFMLILESDEEEEDEDGDEEEEEE